MSIGKRIATGIVAIAAMALPTAATACPAAGFYQHTGSARSVQHVVHVQVHSQRQVRPRIPT
jgi:chromate transport protein ChrA